MTLIVSCNKLNIMNLKLKFLLINDCKMFRSYNTYDFKVLFYLKTTSAEHRKHKRFLKYIKPKLLKEIDKQATFHCDICNGTLSNEIKRLKERSGREILKYRKSNYEHLCTAKLEKKIFSLYFNVFDKIVESEPGLKKYANCDNHFFYAMTNFLQR